MAASTAPGRNPASGHDDTTGSAGRRTDGATAEGSTERCAEGIAECTAGRLEGGEGASRDWHWLDEAACAACAATLAAHPALGDATIELHGPLGAGKTTFVRHLLRALGVAGRIKSPTYAVVETYRATDVAARAGGGFAISHFDFYRFADPRELLDAGLRDLFAAPGLKLVEWPSRAAGLLPAADLRLTIEPQADDSRRVRAEALTARGQELLA